MPPPGARSIGTRGRRLIEAEKAKTEARYSPMPHDAVIAAVSGLLAALSFAYPDTASSFMFPAGPARGFLVGTTFILVAIAACLAPLVRAEAGALANFLRTFYPLLLVFLFFQEAILLSVQLFGGRAHDAAFAAFDRALFGFQPSREFHKAFDAWPWANELMFGSYFLYYVLIGLTPLIAWALGKREEARRQIFVLSSMMALVFGFYVFFRVEGPKYWFADLRALGYSHFRGGFFTAFFQRVFTTTNLYGAAFPSTHVCFTVAMAMYARRIDRRLSLPYAIAVLLVSLSTVYLYAHYVADVLGGLVAALVLVPLLSRTYPGARELCSRLGRPRGLLAPEPSE
ncbi:MAG TPA: phosphatase PAP2 family protein, partial [Rectinemataceae bacterium]|nr:phosphatase PAP2 family protein [Rectinemataceae bacterium]